MAEIKFDSNFAASLDKMARKLKRAGKNVNAAARRAVINATNDLRDGSVKRSPYDEGNLEGSHHVEIDGKGTHTEGTVYIPEESEAGPYAEWLHEGDYMLGPGSLAKQMNQAEIVGPKFLERALEEDSAKREQAMFDEIRKELE